MGGAEFTVFAALIRWVYRPRPMGDNFGLPVSTDWRRVRAATVGVAGAVAGGWLIYGPGWLPWWASLMAGYAAGGVCERLALWWAQTPNQALHLTGRACRLSQTCSSPCPAGR